MNLDISIVLSCYKRHRQLEKTLQSIEAQSSHPREVIVVEHGDDGGATRNLAREYGARYFQKYRTDLPAFQNPSVIHNIGIRQAVGKVVVLQGGEVKYENDGFGDLVNPVLSNSKVVTTPIIQALDNDGKFSEWMVHPTDGPRAGWIINFCLVVDRSLLLSIGGFEESYIGYSGEDDQLMYSLRRVGALVQYVPSALASHQWHERTNYSFDMTDGAARLNTFIHQVEKEGRPPVANIGRNWGRL